MNYDSSIYWITGTIGFLSLGYISIYYAKNKVKSYILDWAKSEMDRRMEIEEIERSFIPNRKSSSAVISFNHGGKRHNVHVPYNRKRTAKMLKHKVYLIKNGEKQDISQKPGIDYVISAKDLGGESIIIENSDGNIIREYIGSAVPDFFNV